MLEQLTGADERPYAVVLGGSKVSDKLAVIENLATKADSLVIGGGMCFTFLAAQGLSVGGSLLEEGMIETCRKLLDTYGDVLHLPVDIVVADKFSADSPAETVAADKIPDGKMGLDIGPESVRRFSALLSNARTIFWNGPMGGCSSSPPRSRQAPRVWPKPSSAPPARARSAWWAAGGIRRQRSVSWACRKTGSPTFPPVVAPRWNTLRAKNCPA